MFALFADVKDRKTSTNHALNYFFQAAKRAASDTHVRREKLFKIPRCKHDFLDMIRNKLGRGPAQRNAYLEKVEREVNALPEDTPEEQIMF